MPEVRCVVDCKNQLAEGPVWCPREKALYWVDILGPALYRLDPRTGTVRNWPMPKAIGSFALREKGGALLALQDGFYLFDFKSAPVKFAAPKSQAAGTRFNDGRCDRQGRFWAGTMDDQHERHPIGSLYRCDPDGSVHEMITAVTISNGLSFSVDNSTMYFADSPKDEIYCYALDAKSGAISNKRVFANTNPGHPDGSTVDAEGYYWNAQWGSWQVVRYAPDGRIDRTIEVPAAQPSSCQFGGDDLTTLFITTARKGLSDAELKRQPQAGGIFAVNVGVRGLAEPYFAG